MRTLVTASALDGMQRHRRSKVGWLRHFGGRVGEKKRKGEGETTRRRQEVGNRARCRLVVRA